MKNLKKGLAIIIAITPMMFNASIILANNVEAPVYLEEMNLPIEQSQVLSDVPSDTLTEEATTIDPLEVTLIAVGTDESDGSPWALYDDGVTIEKLEANLIAVGTVGVGGSPWALYDDGVLHVGAGYINWTGRVSPWGEYYTLISEIIFTGAIIAGSSLTNLFHNLHNVITIEGLSYFDTSNVTDMSYMFWNANSLTYLDLSNWDTGSVTNMQIMFSGAGNLTNLDVSTWDTSNVTDMQSMFYYARSLTTLDLSNWDTSNVTGMGAMFRDAHNLVSLDVSTWDTSNVTYMYSMFSYASSLTYLDLSTWDTRSVSSMYSMFSYASSLTYLDLSTWNTSNVGDMNNMFGGASALRILTLGENFIFKAYINLPSIPPTNEYTGYWQNVGTGTIDNPNGRYVLTSAELMSWYNSTMADTWVWQPVRLISSLMIGRFSGVIDRDAATITFHIPDHLVNNDHFEGTITELIADEDELYFWVGGYEWSRRQGDALRFSTGDLVYVADGWLYTLMIETEVESSQMITYLRMGSVTGVINQYDRTITFAVYQHIMNNNQFRGVITELVADEDTLHFFVDGTEWPLTRGQAAGFSTGDLVYVAGGVIYTIHVIIR